MVDAVSVLETDCPDRQQARMTLSSAREDILRSAGSYYAYVNISTIVDSLAKGMGKRLAIVGLPCQLYAIFRALALTKIPSDELYFIGLVCSKSLSYRIFDYYRKSYAKTGVKEVNFRCKSFRGAPGEVRIEDTNGEEHLAPLEERRALARFYRSRRCLYCSEKYNILSDLTVGDCFLDGLTSSRGESLVLVRSRKGAKAFDCVRESIAYEELPREKLETYRGSKQRAGRLGSAIGLYRRESNYALTLVDMLEILRNETLSAFGCVAPTELIRFLVWRKRELADIENSFRDR